MSKLYRVLYCSRPARSAASATSAVMDGDIRSILTAARRRNAADGVTGGLMFSRGCFVQVLEGPVGAVTDTFERIQQDERHHAVTVLQAGTIDRRDFPAWSMAYAGADRRDDPIGDNDVLAGEAFGVQASGGQELLELMRAVIVREDDRLQPG